MKAVIRLATALVALTMGSPTQAASLLYGLTGSWDGRGLYTDVAGDPPERVTCRLYAQTSENNARVDTNGRCAVVSGSAQFSLIITRRPSRKLSAQFSTTAVPETTDYVGGEVGRQMVFNSTVPVVIQGKRYQSRIIIRFTEKDRFTMIEEATPLSGGHELTIFEVRFTRKKSK